MTHFPSLESKFSLHFPSPHYHRASLSGTHNRGMLLVLVEWKDSSFFQHKRAFYFRQMGAGIDSLGCMFLIPWAQPLPVDSNTVSFAFRNISLCSHLCFIL